MTQIDESFRVRYTANKNIVNFSVQENGKSFGSTSLDLNNFKADQLYKLWIDVVNDRDHENDLEFEIGVL